MPIRTSVLLAVAVLSAMNLRAAELDSALAKVAAVGPQGKGNAEAASAWKELAAASAADIPTLLAAIDSDNPLAANYIRSAVDSIVQRDGTKLPASAIAAFVKDTSNDPRARRFAFELLSEAHPDVGSAMLDSMLHDPSVEIRRDAVAAKINQAERIEIKPQSIEVYQAAFDAAVDDDQVKAISKALKDLGQEVDIARHYGFIMNWHIIGPFDNADEAGFDKPRGPDCEAVDLTASYQGSHDEGEVKWQEASSDDNYGKIDLNAALGKHKSAIAYAAATFDAAEARPVQLRWKSKNAGKVWLNGRLIDQREVYHSDGGPALDQYISTGELKKGTNTILMKICQNDQDQPWAQSWAFQLRVCDSVGAAVLANND